MDQGYPATVAAGSFRGLIRADATFHSPRARDEVAVEAEFTGGHLLHLAVAACVLNDLYREAAARGLTLDGVRVSASGGFDASTAESTGIRYSVEVDAAADAGAIDELVQWVDQIAEIPRAVRATAEVTRAT